MAKPTSKTAARVSEWIDVEVPLSTAYKQWTQFEEFPHFMEGVQSVQQLDEARLVWRAEIGGETVEWPAKIAELVPDLRIAWRSTGGIRRAGVVRFDRLADARCRVSLDLEVEPEGPAETAREIRRRARADLKRFKTLIEQRVHA